MLWLVVVSSAVEQAAKQWASGVQASFPGASVEYGEFLTLAADLLAPGSTNRSWLAQGKFVLLLIPPARGVDDLNVRTRVLEELRQRLGVPVSLLTFHS